MPSLTSFTKGFLPPLIICLLIIYKRWLDARNLVLRTFPFLRHEPMLALIKPSKSMLKFLAELHARQNNALLSGYFCDTMTNRVEFSLQSPLLARVLLEQQQQQQPPEMDSKRIHDVAISHAMKQTRNWHRAAQVEDVTFHVQQAVLPIVVQVMRGREESDGRDGTLGKEWDTGLNSSVADQIWAHTTCMVAWTLYNLAKHADYRAEVERELDSKIGRRMPPSFKELAVLPKLHNAFLETLRLHTPSKVFEHVPQVHLEIGDYVVPKASRLYIPLHLAHRNEDFFVDAQQFNPHRFVDRPLELENMVASTFTEVDLVSQCIAKAVLSYVVQQYTVTITGDQQLEEPKADNDQVAVPTTSFNLCFIKRESGRTL